MERRNFIRSTVAAAGLTVGVQGMAAGGSSQSNINVDGTAGSLSPLDLPRVTDAGERRGDMLYRSLGKTGEKVSLIGLGGSHLGKKPVDEALAAKLIHAAVDRGVTFMDNSWDYNKGDSERWMGKALAQGGYRQKVFLMTKVDGRTKESAAKQLDESLKRLQVEHIDLVQFHEVLRFEDPDRIFAEGGALEALLEAKKAGKIRYIGFTGHKDPRIHLYMLSVAAERGFHFDTVQMPLNVMDAHFRSFAHLVVPRAADAGIGVLGMKSLGDGVILKSGADVTATDCMHYAMNLPLTTLICGVDSEAILEQALNAVKTFKPMDGAALQALLAKTAPFAKEGRYELFKTSNFFDQTAKNPDWLGGDSDNVKHLAPQG